MGRPQVTGSMSLEGGSCEAVGYKVGVGPSVLPAAWFTM